MKKISLLLAFIAIYGFGFAQNKADFNDLFQSGQPELGVSYINWNCFNFSETYGIKSFENDQDVQLLVTFLNKNPNAVIQINWHTSFEGDANQNLENSLERAEQLKTYLSMQGISAQRILANGFGEMEPTSSCLNPGCMDSKHQVHRRVEIVLLDL